ncbi:hypothetical protein [Photobacterium phosphoreum]|uniref:hypothetical protein n=1 Tax=Photobacterium phosphoreum TaxID=659 RepID=UPI001E2AAAC5|nr:hypothetical protein [Photobacterium phosphoreum]MCD9511542.1 hypothetical protein [Photobacterium phosphoreum]
MLKEQKGKISTFLAFLGIVIPILISIISIPERSITYEVESKTNLVSSLDGVDGLQISMDGTPVKEAVLYIIKFKNTGTESINVKDFEKDMSLYFDDRIFSVETKAMKPDNLSLKYFMKGNNISIKPLLFNAGDSFFLEIITATSIYPTIDFRISGVSEIEEIYPNQKYTKIQIILFFCAVFLMASNGIMSVFIINKGVSSRAMIVSIIFSIIYMLVTSISFMSIIDIVFIPNIEFKKAYLIQMFSFFVGYIIGLFVRKYIKRCDVKIMKEQFD